MKNPIQLVILAVCLALAGCASAGVKVDSNAVAKIQKGVTTKAEVLALLGAPMTDTLAGDGREFMLWSYAHTQMKGATFIPVVGMFAGGSNTKMTTCQVILNKDKVVEDMLLSDGNIEAKMGR
jgi:outer membrane protein assembly factor BamE (lipoprotein component of BamABCDE complex)